MRWVLCCALGLALAGASAQQLQWTYRETVDAMTDAKTLSASSLARRGNHVHQIEVACDDGRVSALVYFGERVVLDAVGGDVRVMVRWGEAPASIETWVGTMGGATAYLPAEQAEAFGRALLEGERLRVRAWAVGGRALDAEFETEGAAPHVSRVLAGCGAKIR